ncbi:type II secretion system F family protein [Pseudomonas weihenstephanensis]|uniref:Type II secretion system F family protein n=1 Tax=Pseudomonas weihenstephanensis TaxID=1608994 RepID=A0ABS1ZEF6_9PSED|nr:type II secretion system F family protein [Pseudomonas weihenstephanensis]MBM1194423.1 type II secretion system F family protein [Pseudomonas weihenstephanensis]
MSTLAINTHLYRWEGTDVNGERRQGEIRANSLAMIRAQLRRQGVSAAKVRRLGSAQSFINRTVNSSDITLFSRQLATLINAGIPLLQALEVIAKGFEQPATRQLVTDLTLDIAAGTSLSAALRKKPVHFDAMFCHLVEAGEQAGALDVLLQRIASDREKSEALAQKIKKAMTYPIAILLVALLVSAILLIKVVPQFQSIFASFNAQLPAFTLWVIGVSQALQDHGAWLLIATAGALGTLRHRYKHSPPWRQRLDGWLLKLPVLGHLQHISAIARFARTLSTTLAAGVPLLEALDSVAGATGNCVLKEAVLRLKHQVATGTQIHVAMSNTRVFPGMAIQMTAIGEESGTLDGMLNHVATYYESEVDHLVDTLTTLMEPAIIVVLGVVVGGLVIAMYLPIFTLGQVI